MEAVVLGESMVVTVSTDPTTVEGGESIAVCSSDIAVIMEGGGVGSIF